MFNVVAKFFTLLVAVASITCVSFVDYFHNTSAFAYEAKSKYHKDLLILYQTAMRHNRTLRLGKSQQKLAFEIIDSYLQSLLIAYRIYEKQQLVKYYENLINTKKTENINHKTRKKAVLLIHIKNLKDSLAKNIDAIEYLTNIHFDENQLQIFDVDLLIKDTEDNSLFAYNAYTKNFVNFKLNKEISNIRKHVKEYKDYLQKHPNLQHNNGYFYEHSHSNSDTVKANVKEAKKAKDTKESKEQKETANNSETGQKIEKANITHEIKKKEKNKIKNKSKKKEPEIFIETVEFNKLRLNLIESYTDYFVSKANLLLKDYRLNYYQIHDINKYLMPHD